MGLILPEIKHVCVFGVGGVGGYFGGRIAEVVRAERPRRHRVYFIARGEHLRAIQESGLKVVTPERTILASPDMAAEDMSAIPSPDLVLLCVKSYDLERAVLALKPRVRPQTLIMPLLNGVDIYQRIRTDLDEGIVLPACLYMGTHIQSPGVIDQNGGSGIVICGPDPRRTGYSGDTLKAFFKLIGLPLDWRDDPYPAIWEKYIFIAAFGLVSAASQKSLGEIMDDAALKSEVRRIMQEITAIAAAEGIPLARDIVEQSVEKARGFPHAARTSFQRDIESGRTLNEGDLYGGAIIREGARLGVPTPATAAVYRKLGKG